MEDKRMLVETEPCKATGGAEYSHIVWGFVCTKCDDIALRFVGEKAPDTIDPWVFCTRCQAKTFHMWRKIDIE